MLTVNFFKEVAYGSFRGEVRLRTTLRVYVKVESLAPRERAPVPHGPPAIRLISVL
jgi:hypothetical protein